MAIGFVLDLQTPSGGDYSAHAFTGAMSVQYVLWGVGITQIWRYRRQARRRMLREDPDGFAALRAGAPLRV